MRFPIFLIFFTDFEGKNHLSFVMKYYQNSSLQTFLYCNKYVKGNWNTSIQIVITGILYNHDGKSINPKDNIPFSIKGVIYNADYDKSDMLGPKMEFNIDMDEKYIYIWLGKVTPYRLIPVIDKSNNKNQLDLLDLVETNTSKGYVLKNYDNLYVSDTEKLDISKPIGINYSVNFSLYDTTFYTYEKTFEDEEEVNTRLEVVDIDYEKGTINENKKGIFEVKPPVAGYTQLIGYSMSECNIPTLVTPHNTVKEFRNFETKTISDDYIHKLPKRSSLIWEAALPEELQIGNMAPQTFRSMRVIVNDPDSDYFYLLVEEDLVNGFSKWDSTHYKLPTKLAGNLKHNTSTLSGLNYAANLVVSGRTFGKYKGKRCFILCDVGSANFFYLFTDFDTRNDMNAGKANNFTYKKITIPSKIGKYTMRNRGDTPNLPFLYDDYTGYWYIFIEITAPFAAWDWFRTKDFENYEPLEIVSEKNAKLLGLTFEVFRSYGGVIRLETDGNGRFIAMTQIEKSAFYYFVFDNGDFNNPIKYGWIKDTAIQNTELVDAFNLFTTKNGIWYAFIHGEKTGNTDHGLYLYTADNGLTWTKRNVANNSQSYYIALHSDSNAWVSHLWRVGDSDSLRPVGAPTPNNTNHTSVHSGPYKFPQDRERNNVMLPFPIYRRDGYFGEFYFEGTSWRMGSANRLADNTRNNIWHNYTASNNGTTFNVHHNNFIYDEVNDSYWLSAGTNGITNWDYRHHYHMFIPNRIYRVNKMDYTMTCVANLWVDGFFTYPTAGLDSSDTNSKKYKYITSENEGKTTSDSISGIYNYANNSDVSLLYFNYDNPTKTLYMTVSDRNPKKIAETEFSFIDATAPLNQNTNQMKRNTYNKENNMFFWAANDIVYACNNKMDGTSRKIIELMSKHSTRNGYNKLINNTSEALEQVFYIDKNLYALGARGIHIFKNVNINANLGAGNTINGYIEEDYEIIPYPWIVEINEISARETDNIVPNSRWYDEAYNNMGRNRTIYIKELNKLVRFYGDEDATSSKSGLMIANNHGEYDRKYWKGILVFDISTKTFTFTTEAFQEPGDFDDIDYIDYHSGPMTLDKDSYIGKDKEGWYIVSPKTGNIYSVSENWDKFTKRESTNIMTQIVYNNRRKSYVVFNGTTPAEYIENRYKRPQIREIPLVTVDYNIKPENIDKIKQDVINELDKHCKFNNYNNVFFELMIVTKPYEADKDHYLIFKEHGCYNSGNNTDRKNIITRYFIKDRHGYIITEFMTTNERFNYRERQSYLYHNLHINGLNSRYFIPGVERLKSIQNISQPLEDLENSLLKMPTTITLTIYPTTGTAYDFTYSIARQNSDSNNMGLKVYTAEVTKMVNSNN